MNKFPYLWGGVTPPPGSPSTGFAYSDAVIQRKCPKCGCDAGFKCESPKGRKVWPPHSQRIVIGDEHRIPAYTTAEILGRS